MLCFVVTSSDSEVSGGVSTPSNVQTAFEVKAGLQKKRQKRYQAKFNHLLMRKFSVKPVEDILIAVGGDYRRAYFAGKKATTLGDFKQTFESHRNSQDSSSS
jgi:hypothetical protein